MSAYNYRDIPNGIKDDIDICLVCYQKHILKFYPDSRMAYHINGADSLPDMSKPLPDGWTFEHGWVNPPSAS